jgi:transcriptional regulator with XRE-family HTH domain
MITQSKPINWYNMSDLAIATELVTCLRKIRLQQNLTQEQLAEKAGLSRSAISEMENGKTATSFLTIIQLLKALQQLYLLDNWQIAGQINPIQITHLTGVKRLRAAKTARKPSKEESEWEWLM